MGKKADMCPFCGKKMRFVGKNAVCEDCGYVMSNSNINIKQSYEKNNIGNRTQPANKMNTNKKSEQAIVIAFVVVFFIVIAIGIVGGIFVVSKEAGNGNSREVIYYDNEDYTFNNKEDTQKSKTQPESEMFRQLVSHIFGKNYKKVTVDELEKICFMEFGYNETSYLTISYKLTDGEEGIFYYDDVSVETSDLSCFKGLEVLHIENERLEKGDITGLTKLTEIWCNNSFEEIAELTEADKITSIGITISMMSGSLKGIGQFSHITSLRIDGGYIEDISGLSRLMQLKNLEIIDGESIENFSVLYEMPQLETLCIDSENLRDIGFVADMKNLRELTIENSIVADVDCLLDCKKTLEKLNLSFNYEVENYDVVKELTNLTELTLYGSSSSNHDLTLPDFSTMKNLRSLAISAFDDISNIDKIAWLEELTLYRVYDECDLSNLKKLKVLNLIDMSLERSSIETMTGLEALEKISLRNSYLWTNIEEFMNLPNLKEMDMAYCTAGFDINNLKENKSLELLNMNYVTLKSLVDNKWDYQANNENNINLGEHTEIFTKYPNLTELSLSENMLNDIGFAQGLKELRVLDITDNYVTDLSPLSELENVEVVLCYENPITSKDGEGGMIIDEN